MSDDIRQQVIDGIGEARSFIAVWEVDGQVMSTRKVYDDRYADGEQAVNGAMGVASQAAERGIQALNMYEETMGEEWDDE